MSVTNFRQESDNFRQNALTENYPFFVPTKRNILGSIGHVPTFNEVPVSEVCLRLGFLADYWGKVGENTQNLDGGNCHLVIGF